VRWRDGGDVEAALRSRGFSRALIEGFWRPFLGGVLLDRELSASRRSLAFLLRSFALGRACLPAGGMEAMPMQLAARLREGTLETGTAVTEVSPRSVRLERGDSVEGAAVVIAADPSVAGRLVPGLKTPPMRRVGCLYLDAPRATAPAVGNHLVLDGTSEGVINNLCLPSEVAAGYAPEGRTLVSATVLSHALDATDDAIEKRARSQLRTWFGDDVDTWRTLRMVRIAEALPAQTPGPWAARERSPYLAEGLFVAGDHCDVGSIQGALASGRRAGMAVADALA
jgi:protoporphyrinogen oxidase